MTSPISAARNCFKEFRCSLCRVRSKIQPVSRVSRVLHAIQRGADSAFLSLAAHQTVANNKRCAGEPHLCPSKDYNLRCHGQKYPSQDDERDTRPTRCGQGRASLFANSTWEARVSWSHARFKPCTGWERRWTMTRTLFTVPHRTIGRTWAGCDALGGRVVSVYDLDKRSFGRTTPQCNNRRTWPNTGKPAFQKFKSRRDWHGSRNAPRRSDSYQAVLDP